MPGPDVLPRSALTAPQIERTSRTNQSRSDSLLPFLPDTDLLLSSLLRRHIPLPLPARRPLPLGPVPSKFGIAFTLSFH